MNADETRLPIRVRVIRKSAMAGRTPGRALTSIICILLFAESGCTNQSGALTMSIEATKDPVSPDRCIPLRVTLKATGPAAAVPRFYNISVELQRENSPPIEGHEFRMVECGMQYLGLLPLVPFVIAGQYMDAADVGGRFRVVTTDRADVRQFQMGRRSTSKWLEQQPKKVWLFERDGAAEFEAAAQAWPPGEYKVRATIPLDDLDVRGQVVPLGWTLFHHSISAETRFRVAKPNEVSATSVP